MGSIRHRRLPGRWGGALFTQLPLDVGLYEASFPTRTPHVMRRGPAAAPVDLPPPFGVPRLCDLCRRRVRNKANRYHLRCAALLRQAAEEEETRTAREKARALEERRRSYPPARWCEACRRLDNSMCPAPFCTCGRATTDLPVNLTPKPGPDPNIRRIKRRNW